MAPLETGPGLTYGCNTEATKCEEEKEEEALKHMALAMKEDE